jgi:hypothetical protein
VFDEDHDYAFFRECVPSGDARCGSYGRPVVIYSSRQLQGACTDGWWVASFCPQGTYACPRTAQTCPGFRWACPAPAGAGGRGGESGGGGGGSTSTQPAAQPSK